MNISKIKKTVWALGLLTSLFALVLSSCQDPKGEDIFDKSNNERVSLAVKELKDKLCSSEHGWIMQYYPGRTGIYGGFVIGLRFNDKGEVLATSQPFFSFEKDGTLKELKWDRSTYSVRGDRSVTLNFDTFNDAIHYFSDTDNSYVGGTPHKTFEGDYEFLLALSKDPNVINLTGRESNNKMRLIRATEPIENYMKGVAKIMKESYSYEKMYQDHKDLIIGKIGSKDVEIVMDREYQIVYVNGKDLKEDTAVQFIYTPKGLHLREPFLGVEDLIWSESDNCFLAGQDKLIARDDPNYPEFAKFLGEYDFNFTDFQKKNQSIPVTFEQAGHNLYVIKGLSYDILARFDTKEKTFVIFAQKIDGGSGVFMLCNQPVSWKRTDKPEHGMYALLKEGTTNTYIMKDTGSWGTAGTSFVVTNGGGKFYDKTPNYFVNLVFVKK